jgi:hypothetical protein
MDICVYGGAADAEPGPFLCCTFQDAWLGVGGVTLLRDRRPVRAPKIPPGGALLPARARPPAALPPPEGAAPAAMDPGVEVPPPGPPASYVQPRVPSPRLGPATAEGRPGGVWSPPACFGRVFQAENALWQALRMRCRSGQD